MPSDQPVPFPDSRPVTSIDSATAQTAGSQVDSRQAHHWVVTFRCPDQPGIVHAVTGACAALGGNITELQQFTSTDTGQFFMRVEVDVAEPAERFADVLADVAARFQASFEVHASRPVRTLLLASTAAHCVNDLLFRRRAGLLPIDVPLILANHPDLADLASFYAVGFESHRVDPASKPAFEHRIREAVAEFDIELVVLARYMQILSPELCADLQGRVINIHHSFLPGFKGANPYRQAHERGVKLIGATAHFVTPDLDEGPIIEQRVARVDHTRSVPELVALGQEQESATLSAAVRLFAQHRVFTDGIRTVVFQ